MIILTHLTETSVSRRALVVKELEELNSLATILTKEELDISLLPELYPSRNNTQKFDHEKAHWSSCSTDLPDLPDTLCINDICNALPKSILRVKGTRIGSDKVYTYFEGSPDGEVDVRPYNGAPITGAKLLTVGPGSELTLLNSVIAASLEAAESGCENEIK